MINHRRFLQQGTDNVSAQLTPREAVLNRNAAELAGRQRIAALNMAGNVLALLGVDLASARRGKLNFLSPADSAHRGITDTLVINKEPRMFHMKIRVRACSVWLRCSRYRRKYRL
jgi:hypothetical protein